MTPDVREPAIELGSLTLPQDRNGPPGCGNGGFVCGALSRYVDGPCRVVLHAPAPLCVPLRIVDTDGTIRLLDGAGVKIATAQRAEEADLPVVAPPPPHAAVRRAQARFPGFSRSFHADCLTCRLAEPGRGMCAHPGQLDGRPAGWVAGEWTPHSAFEDADGLTGVEALWAALDCPGAVAWIVADGDESGQGGWLGTMTAEVRRRPASGETCVLTAWPIEMAGRKRRSGTALQSLSGEVLARSHQTWIWLA